jgi:hypothetical protein
MRAKTCIEGSNPSVSAKIVSNRFQALRTLSNPFWAFKVLIYSIFRIKQASSQASMSLTWYRTLPTIFEYGGPSPRLLQR